MNNQSVAEFINKLKIQARNRAVEFSQNENARRGLREGYVEVKQSYEQSLVQTRTNVIDTSEPITYSE